MTFTYEKDADNIVILTMDMLGRSSNVLNDEFRIGFADVLNRLAEEDTLAGVIIASAKETFLAGADLDQLIALDDPKAAFDMAEAFKAELRRLEALGVPVVAALNGSALGGGMELALACHHRISLDKPNINYGFPEVTLGLIPGGGGITRLTRLLGIQDAVTYIMEGTQLDPQGAQMAGFIDDLADDMPEMLAKARAWIAANPQASQPWEQPSYRIPGGDLNGPKIAQMLAIAPAILKKKTYGNYPAPEAIMTAAVEGAQVDFETACRIESRYFAKIATGQVAKNMMTAFWFQLNEIKKGASRPKSARPTETKKLGVLGAGMMGHGIAYVAAQAGVDVVLKDVSLSQAEAGVARIDAIMAKYVSRGRMADDERRIILDRIQPTASSADLAGCDLVIEAVFEDRTVKAQVIEETEAQLSETAIFASNTSTLPISSLAEASARPENFIGMHFFSPVQRMPLVEIIRGQQTSDQALATAFDFVQKIGKTPIVVNDSRGFYTTRVFSAYTNEGLALLAEGQHPRAIESAGLQAGMAVGPLAVIDEVSLSLVSHILEQTHADFAAEGKSMLEHPAHAVVDFMVNQVERLGRAHGGGFYEYPLEGPKHLWPELQSHFPLRGEKLSQTEMMERLMFIQALETVRCLEEGVLTSVADANIGSIFGLGFPAFKGGTLQYINDYGVAAFVFRSQELTNKYGDRFEPRFPATNTIRNILKATPTT